MYEQINLIYTDLLTRMYVFGCRFTLDRELVKDCIHDVFLKLCEMDDISGIRCMPSYLFRALKNELLNKLKNKPTEIFDETIHSNLQEISFEERFIEAEQQQILKEYIEKSIGHLTARQRQAISLYYLERQNYAEISAKMGIEPHSAVNLISQGLKRLREHMPPPPEDFFNF